MVLGSVPSSSGLTIHLQQKKKKNVLRFENSLLGSLGFEFRFAHFFVSINDFQSELGYV